MSLTAEQQDEVLTVLCSGAVLTEWGDASPYQFVERASACAGAASTATSWEMVRYRQTSPYGRWPELKRAPPPAIGWDQVLDHYVVVVVVVVVSAGAGGGVAGRVRSSV